MKTKQMNNKGPLEACIEKLFGHQDLVELDRIEQSYSKSTMLMFEIVKLHPKGSVVKELFEDTEFKPVVFPEELFPLLKCRDVFLATIGFKNDQWTVLYLSNPYH